MNTTTRTRNYRMMQACGMCQSHLDPRRIALRHEVRVQTVGVLGLGPCPSRIRFPRFTPRCLPQRNLHADPATLGRPSGLARLAPNEAKSHRAILVSIRTIA
jgi:hypothetical protein